MGLIRDEDIYSLFANDGTAKLHVGDIDTIPRVDAVPVVHGRWRRRSYETTCSACRYIYYSNHDYFMYCPNCGAEMDGVDEE